MVRGRGQGVVVEPVADDHGRLAERHQSRFRRKAGAVACVRRRGGRAENVADTVWRAEAAGTAGAHP